MASKYRENKIRRLIVEKRIHIESISKRYIFFKVEGDHGDYIVKKTNGMDEWSCVCMHGTFNIVKDAVCTHIEACDTLLDIVEIDHPDYIAKGGEING